MYPSGVALPDAGDRHLEHRIHPPALGHAEIGTAHDALMTVHDAPSAKAEVGVPLEPMPSHGLTKSTYISVLISVPASYAFPENVRLSPTQRGSRPESTPANPPLVQISMPARESRLACLVAVT
jgi:hypothetical protein